LGVIFYQLLCGEVPFRGSHLAVINQVLREEPQSPRTIDPKIPRELETICLKAMAKKPADRYPTASDFAEDLERWLQGEPVMAKRTAGWQQAIGRIFRRKQD
jgi:serine/threonine protein kinase